VKAFFSNVMRAGARGCLMAALSAAACSATAQAAPEMEPTVDLSPMFGTVDPQVEPVLLKATLLPQIKRFAPASAALPAPKTWLLPMQSQGFDRVLRVSGETGLEHFVLDLPDLGAPKAFFLSYRTSVDVLPERSELRVSVNGVQSTAVIPVSTDQFQKLQLDPSLLMKGRNEIVVAVSQAHRIACGPEASFQLWSEFDLNASGLELSADAFSLNVAAFKAALVSQVASGRGVALRGSEDIPQSVLAQIATRLSGISEVGGGWIRQESGYGPNRAALDLMRIRLVKADTPSVSLRKGADGTLVLVLALGQTNEGANLLDAYLPQPAPADDLPSVATGAAATLESLGFPDTSASNHYSRHDLNFRLPSDWLDLASHRASLTLLYSFATNLPKGSLLIVKVNETTIQALPLDENGGGLRPALDISFPARLLTPGANAVTFEATVPGDPANSPCATGAGPLFTIFGQSTLTVPDAPAMQFVGMGPTLLGLPQAGIGSSASQTGDADKLADAGALALISQMAPLAGQPVVADAKLSVASLTSASDIPLANLGMSQRDLGTLLPDATNAKTLASPVDHVVDQGLWDQSMGLLQKAAQAVVDIARPGDPALRDWMSRRRGEAVLLQPDPADPDHLWLIIGPSIDPVKLAQAVAAARIDPKGPQGLVAVLTKDGTWQSWHPMASAPVMQEPWTLANFRSVIGTYASWSPLYFVFVLFGLTAFSVLIGLAFVMSTRGERKQ